MYDSPDTLNNQSPYLNLKDHGATARKRELSNLRKLEQQENLMINKRLTELNKQKLIEKHEHMRT